MKERETQDSLECNMYGLAIQADPKHDTLHASYRSPRPGSHPQAKTHARFPLNYVRDHPIDIAAFYSPHLLLPVHLCEIYGALTKLSSDHTLFDVTRLRSVFSSRSRT